MKRIVFTIFAMLLMASTKAQNSQSYQPDTVVIILDTIEQPLYTYGGVFTLTCQYDSDGLFKHSNYKSQSENSWHYKNDQYSYDNHHNCTLINTQLDGYDSYDVIETQTRYTYNDGLLKSYGYYVYNMHKRNPWECHDSIAYEHDKRGRIVKEKVFYLSEIVRERSYVYDGNVTSVTTEGYPYVSSGTWQVLNEKIQTFSDDGKLLDEMTITPDQPTTQDTYSYTEDGKLNSVLSQKSVNSVWENVQLLLYTFNSKGQLVLAEIKKWQDNDFAETFRAVYELDNAGCPTEVRFEKKEFGEWVGGSWQNGFYIYSESHLKRQNDILCSDNVQKVIIHYANTPLPNYDVDESPAEQSFATLHPNPTSGLVTITGQDLKAAEVHNALGQLVATATGKGETMQIDIANLPAGVYFVRVTDEEGRKCVRKVVKE